MTIKEVAEMIRLHKVSTFTIRVSSTQFCVTVGDRLNMSLSTKPYLQEAIDDAFEKF